MNWSSIKTYLALTLVSLFYGINYSVLKIVVPEFMGPYGFIVLRVVTASIIFWIIHFFNREKINWKSDGWVLVLCAFTGVAVNQLLFYKGLSLTSAVNGSIIMTLTPVLVLIWAALLIGERITRTKVIGVLLGLIGAVVILYQPDEMLTSGDWRGDILVFINGASYACYLVLVKPLMKKYQPMTVVTWVFTIAILFVVPVGYNQISIVDFTTLPSYAWWSMTYTIIIVTVVVYFLNAWTLVRVNSSVVGAFIYLQPVFASLTAILFFDEIFLLKHLLAAAFVFVGVYLVTKKGANQKS
ncbi:Permease of the drug/metabolite transporter (DMT) superfamily [Ekhidna lutea]|uniref:Permease of the drug/metabolite transporter (DMT) superfamily n=1 Tax=Ekhidna lutea TaxID=447679 RepID=A0A239KQI0_EKHLU|nr:DMT family transporter [Ekhidna lutea]SNT20626.1 Permease of the drug/metabolite transporter (DMT) superfamily [Ekhidna lutea]